VLSCSLSPDGRYLACALGEGGGLVWDVAQDEYSREIESPTGSPNVGAVAFTSDPLFVIAAVGDIVQVHSIPTGRYERLHSVQGGHITSLAVSKSGQWLAVADDRGLKRPGSVWLHQVERDGGNWRVKRTQELANPNAAAVRLVAFSPDGEQLVSCDDLGMLVVRRTLEPGSPQTLATPRRTDRLDPKRSAAFSPDSRRLAAAVERRVVVWDAEAWKSREFAERHRQAITSLAWSGDGRWLISAAADGLLVWDASTGEPAGERLRLDGATDIRTLVFLGSGEWLLTGSSDKRFLLWSWRRALPLAWQLPEELRR
jgi:WD40 repeat protein